MRKVLFKNAQSFLSSASVAAGKTMMGEMAVSMTAKDDEMFSWAESKY